MCFKYGKRKGGLYFMQNTIVVVGGGDGVAMAAWVKNKQ